MIRRVLAILKARNIEFVRDRGSMAWAVLMPIFLVFGLAFIFSGDGADQFTIGTLGSNVATTHPFLDTRYINFVAIDDETSAIRQVGRHQLDLLVDLTGPVRYWVNPDSPSGYIAERLLLESDPNAVRQEVVGEAIRYVDWVVPGILGMNIMFSCLFGVGYVVVRYRKNGFLRRLQATPLSAFEFISAQAISRLLLTLAIQAAVFIAISLALGIAMNGSYAALLMVAATGCAAMIALALVLAARVSSEELAGGLVNVVGIPMVLLSGVFFSLEGSPAWLQSLAAGLPLTQMLTAARAIMIDGAGVVAVLPELSYLATVTLVFLLLGALLFRWRSI